MVFPKFFSDHQSSHGFFHHHCQEQSEGRAEENTCSQTKDINLCTWKMWQRVEGRVKMHYIVPEQMNSLFLFWPLWDQNPQTSFPLYKHFKKPTRKDSIWICLWFSLHDQDKLHQGHQPALLVAGRSLSRLSITWWWFWPIFRGFKGAAVPN